MTNEASTRPKTSAPRAGTEQRALGLPNSKGGSTYVYVRLGSTLLAMINNYQKLTRTTRNRAVTELVLHGLGYLPHQISEFIDPDPDPRDERRPGKHLTTYGALAEVTWKARNIDLS